MKKPSRKIQSVYCNQNALVRAVFERVGDARKVVRVALDYAKRKHVGLICDDHGDVLKASFPVENNAAGIAPSSRKSSPPPAAAKSPKTRSSSAARTRPPTSRTSPKPSTPKTTSSSASTPTRPRRTAKTSSPALTPSIYRLSSLAVGWVFGEKVSKPGLRILSRNPLGETPSCDLNAFEKWNSSPNPNMEAICLSVSSRRRSRLATDW